MMLELERTLKTKTLKKIKVSNEFHQLSQDLNWLGRKRSFIYSLYEVAQGILSIGTLITSYKCSYVF